MAFIVQDDTGNVANANSYANVADFKSYHDDRNNDYSSYTDTQIEQALVRATDYLDIRFNFVGFKLRGRSQTTEWPRHSAYDIDDYIVNGVPPEVKEATFEYGFLSLSQTLVANPTYDSTGQKVKMKREKVGPIEEQTEYVSGSVFHMPTYPNADNKLINAGLVKARGRRAARA